MGTPLPRACVAWFFTVAHICYNLRVMKYSVVLFVLFFAPAARAQTACQPAASCAYLAAAGEAATTENAARFAADAQYAKTVRFAAAAKIYEANKNSVSLCADASVAAVPPGLSPFQTAVFLDAFVCRATERVADFNPFSFCSASAVNGLISNTLDESVYRETSRLCESAALTAYHICLKNTLDYTGLRECRENYRRYQRDAATQKTRLADGISSLKNSIASACVLKEGEPLSAVAEEGRTLEKNAAQADAQFAKTETAAQAVSLAKNPPLGELEKLALSYAVLSSSFAAVADGYRDSSFSLGKHLDAYCARLSQAQADWSSIYASSSSLLRYAGLPLYGFEKELHAVAEAKAALVPVAAVSPQASAYADKSVAAAHAAQLWKNMALANAAYANSTRAMLDGVRDALLYGKTPLNAEFVKKQSASAAGSFAAAGVALERLSGRAPQEKPLTLDGYSALYRDASLALEALRAPDLPQRLHTAVTLCEAQSSSWKMLAPQTAQAQVLHDDFASRCAALDGIDSALSESGLPVYALWEKDNMLRNLAGLLAKDTVAENLLSTTLASFASTVKPGSCPPGLALALGDYLAAPWAHSPATVAAYEKLVSSTCH